MPAIETEHLTKEFGTVTAVADIDLTVDRGEVYGFLGPNGAGKSTTISLLMDYVRPTRGTARVLGRDAQGDAVKVSRRVGVLPEGCGLYDRLSGREHLEFAIAAADANDDPDDLLRRVGLDGAGGRPVGEYSTGMGKRLALALALVGDPELLILDEPASGMDPNGVRRLREIVTAERDRGTTVFFSSHVLEQVEAVCDRVGIVVDGQLVVSGDVDELRAEHGHSVRLSIDADGVPSALEASLEALPPVSAVRVGDSPVGRAGTRLEVDLDDESAKAAVIRRIEERATVQDFSTERRSLEALFRRHAGEER